MPAKNPLVLLRLVAVGWLTLWLALITVNNITDFGTNENLIAQMFRMQPLVDDPVRGNGIEWRALPAGLAAPTLVAVTVFEALIVALLARSLPAGYRLFRHGGDAHRFTRRANVGLVASLVLPAGFLAGGMWFGYWMFLGPVQQVHLTLLIIVVLVTTLVNLPAGRQVPAPEETTAAAAPR